MRRFRVALIVLAAAVAGYVLGSARVQVAQAARTDAAQHLMQVDRDFDAATARQGLDGWVSYFAEDGIMMPTGSDMVVGAKAIREYESKAFAVPGFALRWEPVEAGVSGDLGYTYGLFKSARNGADGNQVFSYGKYVTIWRKQRDKSWRVALDIGNSNPAPTK
jgi:ketosteroid isomerase-like protein